MKVIICGDLVVSNANAKYFASGCIENIFSIDLLNKWYSCDFRIFNLEQPICDDNHSPIAKSGPHLKCNSNATLGIKTLNPSLVCLSNNHIMDYGKKGLEETIEALKNVSIPFIGVGSNLNSAKKNSVFSYEKVSIINCCEHEFSFATESNFGAFSYSDYPVNNLIKQEKEKGNYVIVIYHGGKEEYRYPTPMLQKRCRLMVDSGADFITCQHSHCVGCYEKRNNSTVLYGQGNFLFEGYKNNDYWKTALMVEINTDTREISYYPIVHDQIVRLASEDEKDTLNSFFERSEFIKNQSNVEKKFEEYVNANAVNYLCRLFCFSKFRTGLEKKIFKGFFVKKRIKKHAGLVLYNSLICEPHNEIIQKVLKDSFLKENKK